MKTLKHDQVVHLVIFPFYEEGYEVVVVGEKDHPEVKGLLSYGSKNVRVAAGIAELVDMPRVHKLGIVAQTTLPMEKLEDVVSFCLHKATEIKVFNTICNATSTRQTESAQLAKSVDVMVVVGGITRLTESGLSITQWKPITGAIPPLTHDQWMEAFRLYQQIPEYQQINRGMSLSDFQFIFFWSLPAPPQPAFM